MPRYFLESDSAKDLRCFLSKNTSILQIIDFRITNIFGKKISLSPCIITFKKTVKKEDTIVYIINTNEEYEKLLKGGDVKKYCLMSENSSWVLASKDELELIKRIKK